MKMSAAEFMARFPNHPASKEMLGQGPAPAKPNPPAKGEKRSPSGTLKPSKESILESKFQMQILALKLPPAQREYKFHPDRKWRMDFAWPELLVAAEIEGGVWGLGRHNRPRGFIADTEKYNTAAEMGWTVLRFTGSHIRDGRAIDQLAALIRSKSQGQNLDFEHDQEEGEQYRSRRLPIMK